MKLYYFSELQNCKLDTKTIGTELCIRLPTTCSKNPHLFLKGLPSLFPGTAPQFNTCSLQAVKNSAVLQYGSLHIYHFSPFPSGGKCLVAGTPQSFTTRNNGSLGSANWDSKKDVEKQRTPVAIHWGRYVYKIGFTVIKITGWNPVNQLNWGLDNISSLKNNKWRAFYLSIHHPSIYTNDVQYMLECPYFSLPPWRV